MISFPGCKINIGLQVISKRDDGFHNLESIFYPIPWTDVLEFKKSDLPKLEVHGTALNIDFRRNIVWQAYELLRKDFGLPPLEIHLLKSVPSGAGLGGGSANGSAMLNLLNEHFDLDLSTSALEDYAAKLGSDCPFFIRKTPAFIQGRGEILEPSILSLAGFYIQLINPGIHISTQTAFSGIQPKAADFDLRTCSVNNMDQWADHVHNDFENGIFKVHPELKKLKDEFYKRGAIYSSMTGTGSTVYGIFKTEPAERKELKEGWSQFICRL